MTLNTREWNLLVATVLVILLGSTWMLGGDKLTEWRELRDSRANLELQKRRHESKIGRKDDLMRRLDVVKLVLPQHGLKQDLKSDFMQRIQNLADKSLVTVEKLDSDNEKAVGDSGLFKMAVKVNWKGALKELVPFLYDLQSQGAVMDVRDLSVKSDNTGMLKGTLAVDFAYSRSDSMPAPATTTPTPMETVVEPVASPSVDAPTVVTNAAPSTVPEAAPKILPPPPGVESAGPVLPGTPPPAQPAFPATPGTRRDNPPNPVILPSMSPVPAGVTNSLPRPVPAPATLPAAAPTPPASSPTVLPPATPSPNPVENP
jgi:hypothetical protein